MFPVDTKNQTLRELLGNGTRYQVPPFQRDYSWGPEEWEDLWFDLLEVIDGGDAGHYMGYLVLQARGARLFDVIDGQQRLTTLTLLILAALKALRGLIQDGVEEANNTIRLEELRKTYVGTLDPVSLASTNKLTLNNNSDGFFRTWVTPLRKLPRRGLNAAEKGLRDAFEWFSKRVEKKFASERTGEALARFVGELADALVFTVIKVDDELNAFKVFETLNARGVQLSPTDLLKNRLFAIASADGAASADGVATSDMSQLQTRWEQLVGRLGEERFPDFLRTHWNSRYPLARRNRLYKDVRATVRERADVFGLLEALEDDVEVFAARRRPDDPKWEYEQREGIAALQDFAVRQPWPLLLAVHRCRPAAFTAVLRACVIISVRYNVIGRRAPSEQERVYSEVARRVSDGTLTTPQAIISELAPIYLSDVEFGPAFSTVSIRTTNGRNKKVVRYLLAKLAHGDGALSDPLLTLEHVLPESLPDAGWADFRDDEHVQLRYRLGNYVLLEQHANRKLAQAEYGAKRAVFAESKVEATNEVAATYEAWTPDVIKVRQRQMASRATAVWRLSQLHSSG